MARTPPSGDEALLTWVNNYSSLITANPTSLGLTALIATTLAGKVTAYSTAVAAAKEAPTRGGSTINQKRIVKTDLIAYIRETTRTIQGDPSVTEGQKYNLGINMRTGQRTPIGPTTDRPTITVVEVSGRQAKLKLRSTLNPDSRAKPYGVVGISVFSYIGTSAPADPSLYKFEGNMSRLYTFVEFPSTIANGAQVWFTAFYFNERMESGPMATPVTTIIPGGLATVAA